MTAPWLSIIGIGEDGVDGISPGARALIAQAKVVIGGHRHLALADRLITGKRQTWPSLLEAVLLSRRNEPTVALASGDPFCFGIGPRLIQDLSPEDWHCLPAPSCLSLACARLGWALQDCTVISFCGRPLSPLAARLQPNTRLLALSEDATTPAAVARFLSERGFGASEITVMEALGGPHERLRMTQATDFAIADPNKLNLLAISLRSGPDARPIHLVPGLDDDAYAHDGQITKREIRAATLSALAPLQGGLLWDIGSGSGSIAIEWMLCHTANMAIAIDGNAERLARAAANAERLGVPGLQPVHGTAPDALHDLPMPDAIFIGGGATAPGAIETAWSRLRPSGRIVANAVTIETESVLFEAFRTHGGTLTRIGVERLDRIGTLHGFRPAMTVLQWAATRP